MPLSDEMKSLYQSLRKDVHGESPVEEELIAKTLNDDIVYHNLEIRLRVVQLVGFIKFFNNMPIYVPEVEQKILDGIKADSIKKNMDPVFTTSFFKVVMDHSKDVQTRLCELLKAKEEFEAKKMFSDSVDSMKSDIPEKESTFNNLKDDKNLGNQKLAYCRELIQNASNNVLNEMAVISLDKSRTASVAMAGLFNKTITQDSNKLASGKLAKCPQLDIASNEMRANAVCYPSFK